VGQMMLPAAGSIYIDSSILIYTVETHAQYWPILKSFWENARLKSLTLITSELATLECLVAPFRNSDQKLVQAYMHIFNSAELRVVPLNRAILFEAAKLRAEISGLRTPDAIHTATALASGCNAFLTNDNGFRRISKLDVVLLNDYVPTES
jgi:predicted nucleic acid-binding protein